MCSTRPKPLESPGASKKINGKKVIILNLNIFKKNEFLKKKVYKKIFKKIEFISL